MAADVQALTGVPVDLVAGLSLSTGTAYQVRNTGGTDVYLWEALAAPTPPVLGETRLHPDHRTNNRTSATIKPDGTDGIWAWSPDGRGHVTVDEVV